jgi:hypothetical protein
LVRRAVQAFVDSVERDGAEEHERAVVRRHRRRLRREAAALVREQARP